MAKTTAIDIARLETFLRAYRALEDSHWQARLTAEQQGFLALQQRLEPLNKRLQVLKKTETPFYNLFAVLNVSHRETRLHTPFLTHLLGPEASHEQGSLFLDSFLQQVLELPFSHNQMEHLEIIEEHSTSRGQLDILMRFSLGGKPHAIVIENKIYAPDQPRQLSRYYEYLTEDQQLPKDAIWLVYLTPRAVMPSDQSIDKELAEKLLKENRLLLLGYRPHIIPWLTACWGHVSSERVKHSLFQYIQTLERL